ncbi:MAG: hypothetical protein HY901_32500, partial [Deltaproteobacteria bacterium]|nr:hypothetical protein [Deltaproteobacteria bacterium]
LGVLATVLAGEVYINRRTGKTLNIVTFPAMALGVLFLIVYSVAGIPLTGGGVGAHLLAGGGIVAGLVLLEGVVGLGMGTVKLWGVVGVFLGYFLVPALLAFVALYGTQILLRVRRQRRGPLVWRGGRLCINWSTARSVPASAATAGAVAVTLTIVLINLR